MLARQLSFRDGRIELMGQNVLLCPSDFMARYLMQISDNSDRTIELYESAKLAVREGFGINVGKSYGFSSRNYTEWFADILKMAGWGNVAWQENDLEQMKGVIDIQGSPIATYLNGKVKSPCDHIVRGFIAGGGSSAYKSDIDAIEVECEALGAKRCRFIVDLSTKLKLKYPEISSKQLR